jgi:peroxiredoxin
MTMEGFLVKARAPELRATRWFNSAPLTRADLRGKVVMVDFMAYSCVNCVRTFPHMRYLWSNLKDKGFVLIGVQTPEFTFEKDSRNIEDAIRRHGLEYPIAVDNDYAIWDAFGNRFWPQQWLIDVDGFIRHSRAGEGGEAQLEEMIIDLLREAGRDIRLPPGSHQEEHHSLFITPETYCGILRSTGMGNPPSYCTVDACTYNDEEDKHQPGVIYLNGCWKEKEEYLEFAGWEKGHLLLRFKAAEANLVMTAQTKVEVDVQLDGKPISKELAGKDVNFINGRAAVRVEHDDMYRLFKAGSVQEHELRLVVRDAGLRAYAFTFG